MKRWRWIVAASLLLLSATVVAAEGEMYQGYPVVRVVVDGKSITSDVPAVILDGRTVLPVRAVADALNVGVQWDQATKTVTLTSKTPVASDPGAPIFSFDGKGQSVSKIMTLFAGAYVVSTTHKGESNFIVWAHDSTGRQIALLANSVGDFKGSKLLTIAKDGKYLFDIKADGAWAITVAPVQ